VNVSKRAGVALMSFIFLMTLVSAIPVEAKVPLRWEANVSYTFQPEWTGVIVGEDGLSGNIIIDVIDWRLVGEVEFGSLIWRIDWDGGGFIEGTLEGRVSQVLFSFIYNGQVTDASEDWAHLIGRNVHVSGSLDLSFWTAQAIFQIV